ncbi:MAG: hypothetical protein ACK5MF_04160 [Vibrio sp.]|uniref:hypothetical protein n=1 Tax=Vibrio sp. TaxID=678 RepID=UPI003A88FCFE
MYHVFKNSAGQIAIISSTSERHSVLLAFYRANFEEEVKADILNPNRFHEIDIVNGEIVYISQELSEHEQTINASNSTDSGAVSDV